MSFSTVLQLATKAYVEGRLRPQLAEPQRKLKPSVIRQLKRISKDIQEGKNLSPAFDNLDDAAAWLKRQR